MGELQVHQRVQKDNLPAHPRNMVVVGWRIWMMACFYALPSLCTFFFSIAKHEGVELMNLVCVGRVTLHRLAEENEEGARREERSVHLVANHVYSSSLIHPTREGIPRGVPEVIDLWSCQR